MFDVNNFCIDRTLRGTMFSTDNGAILWSINQIEDPSMSITSETSEVVDAIGTTIMSYDRGKDATFSGSNSLFDLGLSAAQGGVDKNIASESNTITAPVWFEKELTSAEITAKTVTLPKTPAATGKAGIPYIYTLKGDSTIQDTYEFASAAAADKFSFNGTTLSLPTGLVAGDIIHVPYEYVADGTTGNGAVDVTHTAKDFPSAGKFVMEVLGHDVCNPTKNYYAFVILPNAKLETAVDLSFTSDGKHPFSIKCNQDYCDYKKKLFSIVIPE